MSLSNETVRTGQTLSIIGCGTMGATILSAVMESCTSVKAAGNEPRFTEFIATCTSESTVSSLQSRFSADSDRFSVTRDNAKAMQRADVVLLAFKPYMLELVLRHPDVREALAGKLILSVLAGSPPAKIEDAIYGFGQRPTQAPIFIKRAMMNLAAEKRQSMTVIETTNMPAEYEELSNWIFLQLGKTVPIAPELFDIGGVLAGASGAFFSVAFDGILDGAVSQGMKRADAKVVLRQSLLSLATLLEDDHPAVLREKISSPRGTTIAGLMSLEEDRARWAYTRAVVAASERSKAIGN